MSPVAIVKIIDQDTGMLVSHEQVVKPTREEEHFFDGLITTEYQFDIRFMNTRPMCNGGQKKKMGKWICDLYNNGDAGWFHVVPLDSDEAAPLLSQYEFGKFRHGDEFKNIFPYNNSWWSIAEAENICDAIVIFSDIYRKEVFSKAFRKQEE